MRKSVVILPTLPIPGRPSMRMGLFSLGREGSSFVISHTVAMVFEERERVYIGFVWEIFIVII